MDVRLKHAVALAHYGSFTAAAEAIGVTQSAVTRAVADLERQVGYQLFYRTARGAMLTDLGKSFVDRAARLLDDERELLKGELQNTDPFAVNLRVGVTPALLETIIVEPLAMLKQQHPNLRLEVVGGSPERMAPVLHNGGVDILVCLDEVANAWSGFQKHPMWEMRTTAFVRKGHPLVGEKITVDSLRHYEIIVPSDYQPYHANLRALYESEDIDWRTRVHFIDYFPMIIRLVEKSNAVGTVATHYASNAKFRAKFDLIGSTDAFQPIRICCATRIRWEEAPVLRAFMDALRDLNDPVHRPLYD